jgi:hypothetical protein
MAGTSPAMTKKDETRDDAALTPLFRFASNMLALWGLCEKPGCRRARACKGNAQHCVARYARLAPEDAREGVKAMIEGQRDGVSFDTAQDRAYDEVEAMIEWQARVAEANAPCARR